MWILILAILLGDPQPAAPSAVSPIKEDEEVVFFPTVAYLSEDAREWVVPIHGWIYEPERDSVLRGVALDVFRRSLGLGLEQAETAIFKQRASAFLTDNEAQKQIAIRLGDHMYELEPSEENGHFKGTVRLGQEEVRELLRGQETANPWLGFEAVTRADDSRSFAGAVQLLSPKGICVISDIDDTIKVSDILDHEQLLTYTFLREFEAVPGMAKQYRRWSESGASFHFVSASPWQLYESLSEFVKTEGFPRATFHLQTFNWRDSPSSSLFGSPEETKRKAIVPLLEALPQRQFVLVGDSSEMDPEIYGALAREHPGQIARIFIRQVNRQADDSDRYEKAFDGVPPGRWKVFREASELEAFTPP